MCVWCSYVLFHICAEANSVDFSLSFFLFFFLLITVLSQRDFSHGKFGLLSLGKASCDRVVLPDLLRMLGVLVFP